MSNRPVPLEAVFEKVKLGLPVGSENEIVVFGVVVNVALDDFGHVGKK
jgi:hypothetical protein